jgi:hypothetical protein
MAGQGLRLRSKEDFTATFGLAWTAAIISSYPFKRYAVPLYLLKAKRYFVLWKSNCNSCKWKKSWNSSPLALAIQLSWE